MVRTSTLRIADAETHRHASAETGGNSDATTDTDPGAIRHPGTTAHGFADARRDPLPGTDRDDIELDIRGHQNDAE